MPDLCYVMFIVSTGAVHVNGNFYRNLHWHFDSSLDLVRSVDVDRFVDVHRLLNNRGHLYCPDDFLGGLIASADWYFLLDFDILGDFDNLLYNPLRAGDMLGDFHHDLNRFLDHHLLDNLLGSAGIQHLDLLISILQQLSQHVKLHLYLVLLALQPGNYLLMAIAAFLHIF